MTVFTKFNLHVILYGVNRKAFLFNVSVNDVFHEIQHACYTIWGKQKIVLFSRFYNELYNMELKF
jgi:hypothetical protein